MNTQDAIKAIQDYCKDTIALFPERVSLALDIAGTERITIEMADYRLADEIATAIDDWCTDNDCPELADDITITDIILS